MSAAPQPQNNEPRASRPHMPGYGLHDAASGLLSWDWPEARLTNAHNYWLTTTQLLLLSYFLPTTTLARV